MSGLAHQIGVLIASSMIQKTGTSGLLLCERQDMSTTGSGTCPSLWVVQKDDHVGLSAVRGAGPI